MRHHHERPGGRVVVDAQRVVRADADSDEDNAGDGSARRVEQPSVRSALIPRDQVLIRGSVVRDLGDIYLERPTDDDFGANEDARSCLNSLSGGEVTRGVNVAKRNHELVGGRIVGDSWIATVSGRVDREVRAQQFTIQPDALTSDADTLPDYEKLMACRGVSHVRRRF